MVHQKKSRKTAVMCACYSSGRGARTPKPSARLFVHGVGMTPMHSVGASSQHRPWKGPKLLHTMVAVKHENNLFAKGFSILVCLYVGYCKSDFTQINNA